MANEFGNFATLDPLVTSLIPNTAISNGSNTIITASDPGGDYWCHQSTLTFPVKNGLKIVCEMTYVNDVDSGSVALGIKGQGYETPSSDADHLWYNSASGRGMINNENSESGASYTSGDVIRMEIDASASDGEMSVEFFKNNASQLTETHTFTYKDLHIEVVGRHFGTITMNFGATAFAHTPTSGFVGLSTATLPEPAAINYEDEYFLKTGIIHTTGSTTAVTLPKTVSGGAMVRIKETNATTDWIMFDTSRGVNKALVWNEPDVQDTSTYDDQNLTGTTFTMPSDLPSGTFLLECFYVGAFFQITAFTGNDTARAISFAATLNSVPGFMYIKNLNTASRDGVIYHESLGNTHYIISNDPTAKADDATYFNDTTPTATQFTVGTVNETNENTKLMICYAWANSGPYSFGQHTGNQSTDGDRVNLGGSPQLIVSKPPGVGDSYLAMYRPLLGYNPSGVRQYWEEPYANSTSTSDGMLDFLSNGVKFRTAGTGNNSTNTNYVRYLYFAFGIQPMTDGGANQARAGAVPPYAQAHGGNQILRVGNFFVHIFTSSGIFIPIAAISVEYLVVAGGGGGAEQHGGGGGAGGFRTATGLATALQTHAVTVGAGGAGSAGGSNNRGANGSNSVFNGITSIGGGGGGTYISAGGGNSTGAAGGSGGGGSNTSSGSAAAAGAGTAGQGNAGGVGFVGDEINGASGGGGAGAVGGVATSSAGGAGGVGIASSITGVSIFRSGGGGGGINGNVTAAAGGNGGGGAGGQNTADNAVAGTVNTGGGGGGGSSGSKAGAAGGSGIVIIKYAI